MRRALALSLTVLVPLLAGCAGDKAAPETSLESWCPDFTDANQGDNLTAVFTTNMGVIKARLFVEQAPNTVANFVDLAEAGKYDGTSFHRIISDFMMQGGGSFAAGDIQDEFHHALRHDRPGLLSMANAGPHTGSNQFFITFAPTPHLDDRHAVFGEVVEGMDVVERVNAEAATAGGDPATPVVLQTLDIERTSAPVTSPGQVEITAFVPRHKVSTDGGDTGFIIIVESKADVRQNVTLQAAGGDDVVLECDAFLLPAGQRVAVVVRAAVGGGAAGDVPITVTAGGQETAPLTLVVERSAAVKGGALASGDAVEAHYVGMTVDGQIFDTSRQEVATIVAADGLGYDRYRARQPAQYVPYDFTIGGNVIGGFSKLAEGLHPGEGNAGRMDGDDVYPWAPCSPQQSCLGGRTLLFDLETTPQ